jgi:hypothetical protein
MVCLRNISVDTLHKGDTEDNDNNNDDDDDDDNDNDNYDNNYYYYNNCKRNLVFKTSGSSGPVIGQSGTAIHATSPFTTPASSSVCLVFVSPESEQAKKGTRNVYKKETKRRKQKPLFYREILLSCHDT